MDVASRGCHFELTELGSDEPMCQFTLTTLVNTLHRGLRHWGRAVGDTAASPAGSAGVGSSVPTPGGSVDRSPDGDTTGQRVDLDHGAVVDVDRTARADHCRDAELACEHGGVRQYAAVGGDDRAGEREHGVERR